MRACFALCLVLTFVLGCGPMGPIAGGRLRGVEVTEKVSDWSFARGAKQFQVETRGDRPHSVTAEPWLLDGRLYVASLDPDSKRWPSYVVDDPEVRLRIDGVVYPVRAQLVNDPREREALLQQIAYARGPGDPALDLDRSLWFFRMESR